MASGLSRSLPWPASGDYARRIVDLVETALGHYLAMLGRAIQVVRIAERDCSRCIEPSDLGRNWLQETS